MISIIHTCYESTTINCGDSILLNVTKIYIIYCLQGGHFVMIHKGSTLVKINGYVPIENVLYMVTVI